MGEYDGMDYTWAEHSYECEQNFKRGKGRKASLGSSRIGVVDKYLAERKKIT